MSLRLRARVLRTRTPLSACTAARAGASLRRHASSVPTLRAARRTTSTRSGESHRPWAKASAIPRLPRSSIRHVREEAIRTVAAGEPEP